MKKVLKKLGLLLVAAVVLFSIVPTQDSQAKMKKGTYKINYTVIKPDSQSASYADGSFYKPGKLIVDKKGNMKVRVTIKNASWVKSFKASTGGNKVVGVNKKKNTRTVEFKVKSISSKKPTKVKMHVKLNKKVNGQKYDHKYTVRFKFGKIKKVK